MVSIEDTSMLADSTEFSIERDVDQKLRWARSCSNTVFWSLNSYSAVGFGAVAVNTELPDIF